MRDALRAVFAVAVRFADLVVARGGLAAVAVLARDVDGFFADLLRERAEDGVIAHGPVTLSVDESAARSYSRASAETRRSSEWWS